MQDKTPALDSNPEQKTVMRVYAAIVASVILQAMPLVVAQGIGTLILFGAWVVGSIVRHRADRNSLVHNHMTYLSRTLWLSSVLIIVGVALAGTWVFQQGDHAAIDHLVQGAMNGLPPSETALAQAGRDYFTTNFRLIFGASLLTVGPGFAYFFYRILKGFIRAGRGYRMANPKGLF